MLSIGAMGSGQENYYIELAKEDYYLDGGEPPGRWIGDGAAALGVSGQVKPASFHHLFQGFNADGTEKLVRSAGQERHRPGWDLTFSASKSVSVLWSQSEPKVRAVIQEIQMEAVTKAMQYLEAEAAICRTGKGGATEVKAKLIVATFEHGTSRAQDPNLHTHALVLNVGMCEDGRSRTLESKYFFQNKMLAGALYRMEFSALLQERLGLVVEQKKTWFEVQGVSESLIETYSTRRKEIMAVLQKSGYTSAEAAAVAALTTREVKGHVAREELFTEWQRVGQEHGWSGKAAHALLHRAVTGRDLEIEALSALHQATQKLTQRTSYFTERDLLRAAAEESQANGVHVDQLLTTVRSQLSQGRQFVRLGEERGQTLYTTRAVLEVETKMLEAVERSRTRSAHPVKTDTVQGAIHTVQNEKGRALSAEQLAALSHVTQETGSIKLISGRAGTGKTDLLKAARLTWEGDGYTVRGAALPGKAADGLQREAGIESATIAATLRRIAEKKLALDARTVLVIDEAGMVDTRQMARLIEVAEKSGAKLVLVGDALQLQPIEAGGPFKSLGERIGVAEMKDIKRQSEGWMREAVTLVADGHAHTALYAFAEAGRLKVAEDRDAARTALIADWKHEGVHQAKDNLIISSTNVETVLLNRMAQAERVEARQLGKENVQVNGETFFAGDRVLFTQNSKMYGVNNGNLGTVLRIDENRRTLTARLDGDERRIVTLPLQHYQEMKLGYAITTHKGQGVTVDKVYAMVGGDMSDLHLAYVQLSRSRYETKLFTTEEDAGENLTDLAREMSQLRQKDLASDVLQRQEELSRQTKPPTIQPRL